MVKKWEQNDKHWRSSIFGKILQLPTIQKHIHWETANCLHICIVGAHWMTPFMISNKVKYSNKNPPFRSTIKTLSPISTRKFLTPLTVHTSEQQKPVGVCINIHQKYALDKHVAVTCSYQSMYVHILCCIGLILSMTSNERQDFSVHLPND